jgi:hypothetical protein
MLNLAARAAGDGCSIRSRGFESEGPATPEYVTSPSVDDWNDSPRTWKFNLPLALTRDVPKNFPDFDDSEPSKTVGFQHQG